MFQTRNLTLRACRRRSGKPRLSCISSNNEQKRKTPAPKLLPKSKVFPFLQLPAEIRNIIYYYTLADASGIMLMGTFKHRRRTVQRVSAETLSRLRDAGSYRYSSSNRVKDDERADSKEQVALVPSLLPVCKQIYKESCDILYGNEFIFSDSFALYSFLINLGPSCLKRLKHLRIIEWAYGRGMKGYNHSCFAALVWATNIETFHLDSLTCRSDDAKGAATQFYRNAFPWLEAIGVAKEKVDFGADVLQLSLDWLDHNYHPHLSQRAVSCEEKRDQFREQLSKLLGAQQKRVMAAPTEKKTKKVAKEAVGDS
jgi:hypothetical protein